MSRFFIENGNEGTIETFRKKQLYKLISRSDMLNLIDFNHAEKRLYGRVNRYFQPIVPNERFISMAQLNTSTANPIRVYDFVAEAFRDLQNKFKIKALSGEISLNEKYLTDIVPVSAYYDPGEMYSKYTNAFVTAVGNIITKNNLVFTNFTEFLNAITPYIENFLKKRPFTYPAFVKSKNCPMSVSGLVIEIAKIEPNDDKEKHDHFYNSKNWDLFLNTCNTYGFMVDCNMPNRIVADINSAAMIEKMKSKNPNIDSGDKFIANCYDPCSLVYYQKFKLFLYDLYSYNRRRTIVNTTHTDSTGVRSTVKNVKQYSYEDFVVEIADSTILQLYLKIRLTEEESEFSDYEKNTLVNSSIELAAIDGAAVAIETFEKIINKTFDYSGSLSYIQQRKKKLTKGV